VTEPDPERVTLLSRGYHELEDSRVKISTSCLIS
jgi:hypothetical protein